MSNILAFAETRGGDLRRAGLEAVAAARVIADAKGGQVHAVLFGAAGIGKHAAALGAHGADVVFVAEHTGFTHNNPEAVSATLADKVKGATPHRARGLGHGQGRRPARRRQARRADGV